MEILGALWECKDSSEDSFDSLDVAAHLLIPGESREPFCNVIPSVV